MAVTFDLGISGRTAIVCASSAGLGRACAEQLASAGVEVVINGRRPEPLARAAEEIERLTGTPVRTVVADVTEAEGRRRLLEACPEPDILVNNAAGPPAGTFEQWGEAEWQAALHQNMITPIMLIRDVVGAMTRKRWGRVINITSAAVKAPMPLLGLSNGARSGLTGFVGGLAREVAGSGITINNLLPGHFRTERLETYIGKLADSRGVTFDEQVAYMEGSNPTGRFGKPAELGAVCAFLASEHAAYITGQNFVLDGGAFPGML